MRRNILPLALCFVAIAAVASADGRAQPPTAPTPPKLLSELPVPKAGHKLKLGRGDVKSQKDDDGLLEVTEVILGDERAVTMPATNWVLDVDGWFDAEGFNLTKAYPRSGLWSMRTVKGNRPAGAGSGLSPATLVPQTPPRLYRAGPGDIITHIDGVAVTSYERFAYAISSAANARDIPIVVMDGATGRKHVHYVTAYKAAE